MERAPERVRFAQRSESRQRRLFLKYGYVCVYLAVGQWLPRNDDSPYLKTRSSAAC